MIREVLLKLMGAFFISMITQSCCSILGYEVGNHIDSKRVEGPIMTGAQIAQAETGKKATVFLKNGGILQGKFGGIRRISQEEYSRRYNEYCEKVADSIYLPHYGDTVNIVLTSGMTLDRRFTGFDYEFAGGSISADSSLPVFISVGPSSDVLSSKVYVYEIERIIGPDGISIEKTAIEEILVGNEAPVHSSAVILTESGTTKIVGLEEIHHVRIPKKKNARYYGMGMGMVLDYVALMAIVHIVGPYDWGD